jgi:hypothetical protein
MALGMRNSFLQGFFYAALFLSVFFFVVALLLFSSNPSLEISKNAEKHVFWFKYRAAPPDSTWDVTGVALLYLIGFTAFIRFKMLFKKTGSAELFFLALFIFSLLFEVFKFGGFFVHYLNWPDALIIFFVKAVYFGRIFGLLAIFFSSLYTLHMDYQKYNIIIGVMALVSFALAIYIPFDTQSPLSNGLFKLGDEQGVFILLSAIKLFCIINFVVAVFKREIFMLLPAVLFLLAGRELLLFAPGPVTLIIGGILLLAGIILVDIKMKALYYWV